MLAQDPLKDVPFVSAAILSGVSSAVLDAVLSFGIMAILYFATEELLVKAHEVEEAPLLTAIFFVGFLVCLRSQGRYQPARGVPSHGL
jgi:zinc transporter ZupT